MERNIVKWHFVTDKQGKPTGLRGWDARMENRYELDGDASSARWELWVVVPNRDDDGWGFQHIATGTLFECMAAAEKHADGLYEDSIRER